MMEPDAGLPRLAGIGGGRVTEVNLNLVWDYPVYWSKYKVLRDLVLDHQRQAAGIRRNNQRTGTRDVQRKPRNAECGVLIVAVRVRLAIRGF